MDEILTEAIERFRKPEFALDHVLVNHPELRTRSGLRQLFKSDPDPILRQSPAWSAVTEWLRAKEAAATPSSQHKALISLLSSNLVRAIVTPNWDTLLEKAAPPSEHRGFVVLRDESSLGPWLRNPRALPALIKIHGDVAERRCVNDHVQISQVTECTTCGAPTYPRLLLPDSARRASREMLRALGSDGLSAASDSFALPHFGAILVIGFSGDFDVHIRNLVRVHKEDGAGLSILKRKPRSIFGGGERLVAGEASTTVPLLAESWQRFSAEATERSDRMGLRLAFVEGEERFDAIFGRIPVTRGESQVLAHPEFARLRSIKQLGQKQRFFPSADHSRYEHAVASIGVIDTLYLGLAETLRSTRQRRNTAVAGYAPSAAERRLVRLATLLHDFGHVWFSHLGDDVVHDWTVRTDTTDESGSSDEAEPASHEARAQAFLAWRHAKRDTKLEGGSLLDVITSEIQDIGAESDITLHDFFLLLAGQSRLRHLNVLVASSVDADKLEYLTRDGIRTGRGGGGAIRLDILSQGWYLAELGYCGIRLEMLSIVERIAAERYLMFQSVYHDDRVTALERSLASVLEDYLQIRFGNPLADDYLEFLLSSEARVIDEIKEYADTRVESGAKGEDQRFRHWKDVLRIVEGLAPFPTLSLWLLRPAEHVVQLPLDDASREVAEGVQRLRRSLTQEFRERYRYRAIFSLQRFTHHSGAHEVPMIGATRILRPAEVSPLIAGLRDARRAVIRLGVLAIDEDVRHSVDEQVASLLGTWDHLFEVVVRPNASLEGP